MNLYHHHLHILTILFYILVEMATSFDNNKSSEIIKGNLQTRSQCRNEFGLLDYDIYLKVACVQCYTYTFRKLPLKFAFDKLLMPTGNKTFILLDANAENLTSQVYDTFEKKDDGLKWRACCKAAKLCCDEMLDTPDMPNGSHFCPRTWDGWQCWGDTALGSKSIAECPDYIFNQYYADGCSGVVYKQCEYNGNWFRILYSNNVSKEWSDYRGCSDLKPLFRRLYVHIIAYSISIASLIPSLIIFFGYKQLQVPRITMHKNLFASLLLNGIFVLVFQITVMRDTLISEEPFMNTYEGTCRFLLMITRYFRMTNYIWMFCEGFYLHKLITASFAEQRHLLPYYITGWTFPLLPIVIYSSVRTTQGNKNCWIDLHEGLEWIINGPSLLSLVMNAVFLCHIIWVLVIKLRATRANAPSQYRKAVRATLVLIPLFGIHFFVTIYRPRKGCPEFEEYFIINNLLDGLQGFIVALIFCYMNGEVIYLLKRSFVRLQIHHNPNGRPGSLFCRSSVSTNLTLTTENQRNNSITNFSRTSRSGSLPRNKSVTSSPKRGITKVYDLSYGLEERQSMVLKDFNKDEDGIEET